METVGQILKAAREKRGYSISEVALHTRIGARYLTALEEDRYETFPSETHITGFIRSYARHLEIDPDNLIGIYKRIVLQEAPAPIEELTAPHKQHFNPAFFVVIFASLAFILILFALLGGKKTPGVVDDGSETNQTTTTHTADRSFALGDFIPITIGQSEKRFVFESLTPETVVCSYGGEKFPLQIGESHALDFNKDGQIDLRLVIKTVTNKRIIGSATLGRQADDRKDDRGDDRNDDKGAPGKAILKSEEQVEIRLTITANGIATVNTVKDSQERSDFFLKKGDKITILAKDTVQLTASNPHNLVLNLNNVNLEVDTKNPAAGFLFKWRRNPSDGLHYLEYEQIR